MDKPKETIGNCDACGMKRELHRGRCSRCHLLYGPPAEKPKNGKQVRASGLLDRAAYRERLHFIANTAGRVH